MKKHGKMKLLILIGICICVLSIVEISYAVWTISKDQQGENVVNLDCFNVKFAEITGSNINLPQAFPLTDQEGESLPAYQFTVQNNCQAFASYSIQLEIKNTSTLDSDYIKVKLSDHEPRILTSHSPSNQLILNNTKAGYIIDTGYLGMNETKTFNLRLWLDESVELKTTNEDKSTVVGSTWSGYISINAAYAEARKDRVELAGKEIPVVNSGNGLYEVTHLDNQLEDPAWAKSEYRFAGANPNNYIKFNDEIWRIIGLVNVKTTNGIEQRVKIVRDSIGEFAWDTSETNINSGSGVNEWSQADIMKLINPNYENNKLQSSDGTEQEELVNNSLYWNGTDGKCYTGEQNTSETCNFSTENIKALKNADPYIADDIIWSVGATGLKEESYIKDIYEYEKSKNVGKICSSSDENQYCTDQVPRTYEWQGKVGIFSESDYDYASGKTLESPNECYDTINYYWDDTECINNNWLRNDDQWTMSISVNSPYELRATDAIAIQSSGIPSSNFSNNKYSVRPSIYLKSEVKIVQDDTADGTSEHPYELTLS